MHKVEYGVDTTRKLWCVEISSYERLAWIVVIVRRFILSSLIHT